MTPSPALCLAALVMLGGCAQPVTEATSPPQVAERAVEPRTTEIRTEIADTPETGLYGPATSHMPAVRIDPPEPAPVDPCAAEAYVNGLSYQPDTPPPVVEAYRIVAACLGWSTATIDFYQPGIITDIMPGESRFCWNLQRGQGIAANCALFGPIQGDDTGFFQITSSAHGPNGVLCTDHGYCGSASIKQSPWHSMRSGLILIMRSGKFPWTWDAAACAYHRLVCNTWPKAWSNLP